MMPGAYIYQILTPSAPRASLDPGFLVLDNTANERPDWFEYWPMRKHLLGRDLDEDAFYGFLSPRFKAKTNLDATAVHAFIRAEGAAADVILFSPSIHNSSYHLNVFAHGESEHPGLLSLAERFFARIGRPSDLAALVSDSRNTVNSNYFAARPRFWREWLALTEALYAIAESADDAMGAQLRAPTAYRGAHAAQMKVFVLERLATWLLVTQARFVARAFDPFAARARIYKLPVAIVCDALKIAYATQGRPQYKDLFFLVQGVRKTLNWQIRAAAFLRTKPVRPAIDALASYWDRSGR
jgi:hypothetical protein